MFNQKGDLMSDEKELVSPCGVDCETCAAHTVKDSDAEMMGKLLKLGLDGKDLPCKGCRPLQGRCPTVKGQCGNYLCAQTHGIDFCHECGEFPCTRVHPAADRAGVLIHNMKMFNLCYIQRHGLAAWKGKKAEIKQRYFCGRITFGEGPQL